MRTKILGRSGLEVPIVGLGASAIGIPNLRLQEKQYAKGSVKNKVFMDEDLGAQTILTALNAGTWPKQFPFS
jgi:hypothetical protein